VIVLSLTGRSANAWLLDSTSAAIGSFSEAALDAPPVRDEEATSLEEAIEHLDESMTHEQVLERFFGNTSRFGPLLKREFIARSHNGNAVDALKSLVSDLSRSEVPLVYSAVPLDQIGERLINLKEDLVLSNVELFHARAMLRRQFSSFSEAADHYYQARSHAKKLQELYNSVKQLLTHEVKKRDSAMKAIEADQARFDNPDNLKRCGDLILANLATARVEGSRVTVVDYYDPLLPEIQIDVPDNKTLQQSAAGYFSRYQKARRALTAIAARRHQVSLHLDPLRGLLRELDQEPTLDRISKTRNRLNRLLGKAASKDATRRTGRAKAKIGKPGRRFTSTDGFEVLVGRNDRDNDVLTFRVARSLDIWMHAADYPGSHVVISNPSRNPIPQRAIAEAAELAAFYSQAKREAKAAVHYTQRKFVSKPPRAKPGLVRLSSFKTIMVQPRCVLKRIE
jgi:predicted ribosome quality control (RQC) complex YloA/Tae2 family protein